MRNPRKAQVAAKRHSTVENPFSGVLGPDDPIRSPDLIAGVVGFLDDRSGPLSQRTGRSYISYYSAEVGHYNPRSPSIRTPRRLLLGWLLCKITLNGTKLPAPSRKCGFSWCLFLVIRVFV